MSYRWTAEPTPGSEVTTEDLAALGLSQAFVSQAEAERWLAESYEDLSDRGVTSVSLFDEDRLIYGPMSLLVD